MFRQYFLLEQFRNTRRKNVLVCSAVVPAMFRPLDLVFLMYLIDLYIKYLHMFITFRMFQLSSDDTRIPFKSQISPAYTVFHTPVGRHSLPPLWNTQQLRERRSMLERTLRVSMNLWVVLCGKARCSWVA